MKCKDCIHSMLVTMEGGKVSKTKCACHVCVHLREQNGSEHVTLFNKNKERKDCEFINMDY